MRLRYNIFVFLPVIQQFNMSIPKYEVDPIVFHRDEYLQIGLSVDNVVFSFEPDGIHVLLMRCNTEPFEGMWSLLGDWVHPKESLDEAARRILEKRAGITGVYQEQVHAFGDTDRHPAGRVITVAYFSLLRDTDLPKIRQDDRIEWLRLEEIQNLAFDHKHILSKAVEQLRMRLDSFLFAKHLLPEYFTLSQLHLLYENIHQVNFDKRNFRKRVIASPHIVESEQQQEGVSHRPAKLYTFTN
jgi:8-oxo-dGTP diphosphatase